MGRCDSTPLEVKNSTPYLMNTSNTAIIRPNTTEAATTAAVCLPSDFLSGQIILLNSALRPVNQLVFEAFSVLVSPILVEVEVVRTRITLACTECKQRNYNMTKDKKTHPDRMETKKYCRFCRKHTLHKETK